MSPDLASCRALAGQGYTLIPVIRRLVADAKGFGDLDKGDDA